jgi:hypothetical protein
MEKDIKWSHNREVFNCESKRDVIESHGAEVGDVIYFGEVDDIDPSEYADADDVIDRMSDRSYDDMSEFANGYPEVSPEAKAELQEALNKWAREHCQPTFYRIINIQEYTVTASDIED